MKLALSNPDKFAAAASLSGVTDLHDMWSNISVRSKEFERIFGDINDFADSSNDLFKLSSNLADKDEKPAIFQCCGTDDFLYEGNQRFRKHIEQLDFDYYYQEAPGNHNWDYWDAQIQDVLNWLPLK